jgi:Putative beta-lactamase-inhibitor-like, PepSY-like
MKKIFLFLLLITAISCGSIFAQIRKVPAEVTNAFKAKFPDAQNVEWKAEISDFQANFTENGVEKTAEFSSKGEWKETDTKMAFDSVPAAVKDGFQKSKYSDWTPGSVTLIEKNDNSREYKVYAEKSSLVQKKFLYFNDQGQLVRDTPGL